MLRLKAPLSPASEGVFITGLEPPAPDDDRDALYHRIARLCHLLQSVEEDPKANPHERNTLWLGLTNIPPPPHLQQTPFFTTLHHKS